MVADGIESRLHDLGAFIREQRRSAQLSVRRLAEMTGVSNPYLSQIERGLRKPSAEILQSIANGLRISAETLYVRAGFLNPEGRVDDLEAAIREASELTDRQRQVLLEVYHSFRAGSATEAASAPVAGVATDATDASTAADAPSNVSTPSTPAAE
jgi:transcriptional regulator with XRE-family HTH domain